MSGDTCSNVKVEFGFEGCLHESKPELAQKILCEQNQITARFTAGNYRYEAKFDKADDGWGTVTWKPVGGVKQWARIFNTAKPKATPPAEKVAAPSHHETPKPEAAAPAASPAPEEAKGTLKVSGYVDVRLSTYTINNDTATDKGNPPSGWGLEDGAVYVNYDKGKLSLVMDVPFRRAKTGDPAASPVAASNSSQVAFGYDKAQFYGKYRFNDVFNMTLGQFDTIFGVELNDSKDRLFNKTGIVYDVMLPVTHTGLMLETAFSGFSWKVFSANPNNKGSLGDNTHDGENAYEYGTSFGWSNDFLHAQIGGMTRPVFNAAGDKYENRVLSDVLFGGTVGNFAYDFEVASLADPSKNTLTPTDSADKEDAGTAALFLGSYKVTENVVAALRVEQLKNDPGTSAVVATSTGVKNMDAVGVAFHYKFDPQAEARVEYTSYKDFNFDETTGTRSRFNAGVLFFF